MSRTCFLKITLIIVCIIRCNPGKQRKPRKRLSRCINSRENNMHTQTYKVKGMHCASCSSVIEKTFKKVEGVQSAEVNYGTEKAKVSFDPSKTNPHDLSKHIEPLGYSLEVPSTTADTSTMFSAGE